MNVTTPNVAREMLGESTSVAEHYAALLVGRGIEWGLIGPREADQIWDRHILNCAAIAAILGPGETVIDLGSGAGLPGIVLAMVRLDLQLTLVEPQARRVDFLNRAVDDLGLTNVTVKRGRAEDMAGEISASTVTARALAPLDRLVRWAMPLTEPRGRLLAIKGRTAQAELTAARTTVTAAGGGAASVRQCGGGLLATPTTVVVVERAARSCRSRRTTSADPVASEPSRRRRG